MTLPTPAPLTEQQVAEIRFRVLMGYKALTLTSASLMRDGSIEPEFVAEGAVDAVQAVSDATALLADAAWQRAENARLVESLAAASLVAEACEGQQEVMKKLLTRNRTLSEIVRVVAEADNSDSSVCYQLCSYGIDWTEDDHAIMTHTARCVVEQARAALGLDDESGDVTTGGEGVEDEVAGRDHQ